MRIGSLVRKAMVVGGLLAWAASAQAASFNISNDFGGWLGSVQLIGPTTLGTGNFVGVGCPPNVACDGVAINGLPGVSFALGGPFSSVSYSNGLLNNLVSGEYLEWSFTTPQNGWGGTFQMALNNGLAFQALDLPEGQENLGWIDVTSVDANQTLDGFLGFSSTERFGGVRVYPLSPASSYVMTDVSIAAAEQVVVPEPASLALFGLAGAALTVVRRRRS